MTVNFAGETLGLGTGPIVVIDKEATNCNTSCITGPFCTNCNPPTDDKPCLTRTIGFWGTHPWITNNYAPVQVCGISLDSVMAPLMVCPIQVVALDSVQILWKD